MRIRALVCLVVTGCGVAAGEGEPAQETGGSQSALYVQTSGIRAQRTIPTCFISGLTGDYEGTARRFMSDTWETDTAIAFTPCDSSTPRLNIYLYSGLLWGATTDPYKYYGTNAPLVNVFVKADPATGVSLPPTTPDYRVMVTRATGYGLGFAPEDFRPDTAQCGASPIVSGMTVGAYDTTSVMNTCTGANTTLSASDIDGLQRFYGASQPLAAGKYSATSGYMSVPFAFARGADNTLVQNWWNGSAWVWSSHGGEVGGAPAVTRSGDVVHVFVRMADGSLGQRLWGYSQWQWRNRGIPAGSGGLKGTPAAVSPADNFSFVYARGADDGLYLLSAFGLGGASWSWSAPRMTGLASDPTVVLTTRGIQVFAKSRSGGLLRYVENWGTGGGWSVSSVVDNVASAPVAITDGNLIRVFFRATDGSMGEYWAFADGTGSGYTPHFGVMRGQPAPIDTGSVFVRGSDDKLWERWWNGAAWVWRPHGGPTMTASPTATLLDGTRRVFVRNTAGGIDERYGANYDWHWGGHPGVGQLP